MKEIFIEITEEQDKWITEKGINLDEYVTKIIDELREKQKRKFKI